MEKDHMEILLEDIRSKFDLVLEGHDVLRREIVAVKEEIREDIAVTNVRIDAVHDKLDKKIDAVHDKLDKKIDAVHDKLDKKIDAVHDKLDRKIDAVHDKLDKKIDAVKEDLGAKIDAVAEDLTAHRADTEAHHGLYKVKE